MTNTTTDPSQEMATLTEKAYDVKCKSIAGGVLTFIGNSKAVSKKIVSALKKINVVATSEKETRREGGNKNAKSYAEYIAGSQVIETGLYVTTIYMGSSKW